MDLKINYGNLKGVHFTQWRIEELKTLLDDFYKLFGDDISNIKIWYDEKNDFHMLKLNCKKHEIRIRYYKVFGIEWDNVEYKDLPLPFPSYQMSSIPGYINKKLFKHNQ